MNKYESKYFGLATGIFTIIIFLLAVFKSLYDGNIIKFLRPFVPFYNSTNFLNVLGGVLVTFILGFVLGYLWMKVYNFFDKKFS